MTMKADTAILADVIEREQTRERAEQWESSPFKAMVPTISIKKIGAIFEQFVMELCAQYNVTWYLPASTDYDIVIQGKKIEIKGATKGRNGTFTANQIRPSQDYDYVLVVCLSPNSLHYHLFTKGEAITRSKPQHSGSKGQETRQLTITPDDTRGRSESFLDALAGIV